MHMNRYVNSVAYDFYGVLGLLRIVKKKLARRNYYQGQSGHRQDTKKNYCRN